MSHSGRGKAGAALGPESIPFIYGEGRLARLRRLRDRLPYKGKLYNEVSARIVDIEAGDVGLSSNFLIHATPPQTTKELV